MSENENAGERQPLTAEQLDAALDEIQPMLPRGTWMDGAHRIRAAYVALLARAEAAEAHSVALWQAVAAVVGDGYDEFREKVAAEMGAALAGSSPACDHEWVDARNEAVLSGEVCVKCHAIRAGSSPAAEASLRYAVHRVLLEGKLGEGSRAMLRAGLEGRVGPAAEQEEPDAPTKADAT